MFIHAHIYTSDSVYHLDVSTAYCICIKNIQYIVEEKKKANTERARNF
jgi:hypothetical protein